MFGITASQGRTSVFFTQPLMMWVVSHFLLWCLAGEWQLLSKSLLSQCSLFFGPLTRKSRFLLGHFCLHVLTLPGCQLLQLLSLCCIKQKDISGNSVLDRFLAYTRTLVSVYLFTFQSSLMLVFVMSGMCSYT